MVNKPEEVPKWLLLLLMLFTVVPFFLYVYQFDTWKVREAEERPARKQHKEC